MTHKPYPSCRSSTTPARPARMQSTIAPLGRSARAPSRIVFLLATTLLFMAFSVTVSWALEKRIGEIQLTLVRKPPPLLAGEGLAKYFAGALRATYRSESGRPIEVAFRAWLVGPDGKVANECTSRNFEITPGKPVGSDRLRIGFQDCWPTQFEGKPTRFQVGDMGPATVARKGANPGLWDPNLGLWDHNLGLWARKKRGGCGLFRRHHALCDPVGNR